MICLHGRLYLVSALFSFVTSVFASTSSVFTSVSTVFSFIGTVFITCLGFVTLSGQQLPTTADGKKFDNWQFDFVLTSTVFCKCSFNLSDRSWRLDIIPNLNIPNLNRKTNCRGAWPRPSSSSTRAAETNMSQLWIELRTLLWEASTLAKGYLFETCLRILPSLHSGCKLLHIPANA